MGSPSIGPGMNVLVVLRGPAYGDERSYNGLRLAGSLAKATT